MDERSTMELLQQHSKERDWGKFHTPENLAKSISIEAAELLECFQWSDNGQTQNVRLELADVLTYCFLLANKLNESPNALIREKLKITAKKYPVDKAFGISTKYDQL
ncbi:nucleotide pyrophosphohydrolase [Corynebacterium renale]|nr:nucleotide pyrophosphohydrolase [Corynebacterium renale]